MIDAVVTRFGLARMPFGRDLPPSRLHRHHDCGEAAARIAWAVSEKTIAMITGEVGTGKTVAIRSAVADLDPASHTIIYIGNPATGVRGIRVVPLAVASRRPSRLNATPKGVPVRSRVRRCLPVAGSHAPRRLSIPVRAVPA